MCVRARVCVWAAKTNLSQKNTVVFLESFYIYIYIYIYIHIYIYIISKSNQK